MDGFVPLLHYIRLHQRAISLHKGERFGNIFCILLKNLLNVLEFFIIMTLGIFGVCLPKKYIENLKLNGGVI